MYRLMQYVAVAVVAVLMAHALVKEDMRVFTVMAGCVVMVVGVNVYCSSRKLEHPGLLVLVFGVALLAVPYIKIWL